MQEALDPVPRARERRAERGARQLDRNNSIQVTPHARNPIELELLRHERAALLRWNFPPEMRDQMEACAASTAVETISISRVALSWMASDLTRSLVKRGCRDADLIDLSERLDYVQDTGDASLDGWY